MPPFRSRDEAAGYLAGMIDGEGCVSLRKTKGGHRICVFNTDPDIIAATAAACDLLDLPCKIYTGSYTNPKWKPKITLMLMNGHETRIRLQAVIQLQCPRKRINLETMISQRQKTIRPARAWLEEQYVTQQKSLRDIAAERGCSPPTVYNWLRHYHIPRRSLAAAAIVDWQKRRKVETG